MADRDPELEYRGYILRFGQNTERWSCPALDIEAEKVSTLKTKIDKIIATSRKLTEDVRAIYLDSYGAAQDVWIVAYADPGVDRYTKQPKAPRHVWCMVPGKERYFDHEKRENAWRECETRTKLGIESLLVDTPETRDKLRELAHLEAAAKKARDAHSALLADLRGTAAKALTIPAPDAEQETDRG